MAAQELPVKPPATQKLIRTNQLRFLWKLLEELIRKDSATEFFSMRHNDSVKNPMDFKTIQLRLKNHFYVRGRDCIKDIHLIFSNACKYNFPGSIQVQNAKALENFFYAKLDDMPKPECELHAKSHKSSKSTEVRRKEKIISPNRHRKEKKISPNRRKKEKKRSPSRRKNDNKASYCSSKLKKVSKMMEGGRNSQKKIPSKDKNSAIKEFHATVEEIMTDLTKLYRPLDFLNNLKLYDCLLKIKLLYEKFQKFSALIGKKEDVKKIVKTSLGTSATKKSDSETPLKSKEKMVVLPSKSVNSRVGLFLSDQKDVQLKSKRISTLSHKVKSNEEKITVNPDAKPKRNSILPSANMVRPKIEKEVLEKPESKPIIPRKEKEVLEKPESMLTIPKTEKEVLEKPESKPVIPNLNIVKSQKEKKENLSSDLHNLLRREIFPRPAASGPTVTEESKRQREIAQQKRKRLGGKNDFCLAADTMESFEENNGLCSWFYPRDSQSNRWPKNTNAATT